MLTTIGINFGLFVFVWGFLLNHLISNSYWMIG